MSENRPITSRPLAEDVYDREQRYRSPIAGIQRGLNRLWGRQPRDAEARIAALEALLGGGTNLVRTPPCKKSWLSCKGYDAAYRARYIKGAQIYGNRRDGGSCRPR